LAAAAGFNSAAGLSDGGFGGSALLLPVLLTTFGDDAGFARTCFSLLPDWFDSFCAVLTLSAGDFGGFACAAGLSDCCFCGSSFLLLVLLTTLGDDAGFAGACFSLLPDWFDSFGAVLTLSAGDFAGVACAAGLSDSGFDRSALLLPVLLTTFGDDAGFAGTCFSLLPAWFDSFGAVLTLSAGDFTGFACAAGLSDSAFDCSSLLLPALLTAFGDGGGFAGACFSLPLDWFDSFCAVLILSVGDFAGFACAADLSDSGFERSSLLLPALLTAFGDGGGFAGTCFSLLPAWFDSFCAVLTLSAGDFTGFACAAGLSDCCFGGSSFLLLVLLTTLGDDAGFAGACFSLLLDWFDSFCAVLTLSAGDFTGFACAAGLSDCCFGGSSFLLLVFLAASGADDDFCVDSADLSAAFFSFSSFFLISS
jgi:hypothetical protein